MRGREKFVYLTLEYLLGPQPVAPFLRDIIGRSALHIVRRPNDAVDLFSWNDLNEILSFRGLQPPRFRLFCIREEIAPARLGYYDSLGIFRLRVGSILRQMAAGATMVIASVNDLHRGVSGLCAGLEKDLEVPVAADVYVGWPGEGQRSLSWNDHDTFIIQLSGMKDWEILQPTLAYPVGGQAQPEPTDIPLLKVRLEPAEVLYVPRGWWYRDLSMNAPTMYLAIHFRRVNGIDVLRHMAEQCADRSIVRMDCPIFADSRCWVSYFSSFHREVVEVCNEAGLVLDCLKEHRRNAEPKIVFSLPWSLASCGEDVPTNAHVIPLVRFLHHDVIKLADDRNVASIILPHEIAHFHPDGLVVLQAIASEVPMTIDELVEVCADRLSRDRVLSVLIELAQKAIVTFQPQNEPMCATQTPGTVSQQEPNERGLAYDGI